jgi:hypothetical protein
MGPEIEKRGFALYTLRLALRPLWSFTLLRKVLYIVI